MDSPPRPPGGQVHEGRGFRRGLRPERGVFRGYMTAVGGAGSSAAPALPSGT